MKKFYPVSKSSEELLNSINESDERSFYCFDWTDELEIYGDFPSDSSHIEISLMPCNYIFTENGYTGDSVSEECIWDLKK